MVAGALFLTDPLPLAVGGNRLSISSPGFFLEPLHSGLPFSWKNFRLCRKYDISS
jgi:hypothetical protein